MYRELNTNTNYIVRLNYRNGWVVTFCHNMELKTQHAYTKNHADNYNPPKLVISEL